MAERKRLMTIWRQGANAPWTNLLRSVDGLGYAIHRYTVDGSAEEALLWVEGADTPRISNEPGEVFTLTLARDVGARLTTPSPWLYIVHTGHARGRRRRLQRVVRRRAPPAARAFDEKVESLIVDSHEGANRIQDPHWCKGGQS
jgi:hypothetical protein